MNSWNFLRLAEHFHCINSMYIHQHTTPWTMDHGAASYYDSDISYACSSNKSLHYMIIILSGVAFVNIIIPLLLLVYIYTVMCTLELVCYDICADIVG